MPEGLFYEKGFFARRRPHHRHTIYISITPPLTSDARAVTSVTISTICNSCIVNNTNIAVQNANNTPLDAINNWWGMPTGATHDNIPSGDAVGLNVLHAPHLPTMPFLCDLSDADWIPFSEQDLQNAINSHIPHLGGIAFALIDFEWGSGAKFDILTHPNYGNRHDVAYITIKPNPTGDLITLQLDLTRLPIDETVRQIVTCELVPLFVNSLQQVQNRYVSPSQNITSMVVMERDLMMRFSPPTEITPESTPELVLNYDASCLPNVTPPETIIESGNGENVNLVTIPPLEGEFEVNSESILENSFTLLQSNDLVLGTPTPCNPGDQGWCLLLSQVGDIFTYVDYNQLVSVNRTNHGIVQISHTLPPHITYPSNPSWGKVSNPNNPNHYRLAFNCTVDLQGLHYNSIPCYWDSDLSDYFYYPDDKLGGIIHISPDGLKIARANSNGLSPDSTINIWDLQTNSYLPSVNVPSGSVGGLRWSTADTLYFTATQGINYVLYQVQNNVVTTILDISNLQPYLYDVHSGSLLYWSYNWDNPDNYYALNYLGVWAFTSNQLFYTFLSPRFNIDNRIIFNRPEIGNPINTCIDLFDATDIFQASSRIACFDMGFGYADWASGIDLTFPVPPITGDCPDPNSLPSGSIDYYIAELCQYGITAFPNGLPTVPITIDGAGDMEWHSTQYTYNNPWQASHLEDILIGVEKTALAFDMLANEINPTNTEDAKTIFRRIMGNFYVLNVTNGFQIYPSDGCNGTASSACTSNTIGAITFYSMTPNQHTMVHEIGHRFNFKTDNNNGRSPQSLYGYMETATVLDNNAGFLFGASTLEFGQGDPRRPSAENFDLCSEDERYTERGICAISQWRRGERGWGSGPASQYDDYGNDLCIRVTDFQQDSYRVEEWAFAQGSFERQTEIDEAAADMFLNWVYYKTTNVQEGFRNISWLGSTCQTTVENNDASNPGTVRFNWMQDTMNCIFTNHQDSECKQEGE